MVKTVKKLSEEEIEEYRNETYQMMAAMSGKQVSELMGEPSNRPNFTKNYCIIKQLYLKNCVNPIGSKELYELLQKQGYDAKYSTFRGLTNYYMKNGYIRKTNAKKPFLYVLTEEGKLHAKSPFIKVDENIQRYRNMLLQKTKELIESEPEQFKSIYESIHGTQNSIFPAGTTGSQYSGAIEEMREKINDDSFLQSVDEDKVKELINLGDTELLTDFYINLNDYYKKHKSSMTLKTPEYQSSKPIGERNYYEYLIKAIDKPVTRSLYESLPFRFIYIPNKNQVRLESEVIAGKYRNNEDGKILDFDYVNKNLFQNRMIIKAQKNDHELIFFYTDGFNKYQITTMSFNDYNKAKGKTNQTLKININ